MWLYYPRIHHLIREKIYIYLLSMIAYTKAYCISINIHSVCVYIKFNL